MTTKRYLFVISSIFFFIFFGYGAFFPMIGIFLKEKQFSGLEMGIIMSITPLLLIVFRPMWGVIADYFQRPRIILVFTALISAGILIWMPEVSQFSIMLTLFVLFSLFQSAIGPIFDNFVMNYTQKVGKSYGNYRMWGAISFALAAWLMGKVGEKWSLHYFFYLFAGALVIVAFFAFKLPKVSLPPVQQSNLRKDIGVLMRLPPYLILLLATFCVLGPMLSNNNFFGIFYQTIGGTLAGVGVCFLIGAGSEAPFMRVAASWINKYGQRFVLLASAALSAVQYFAYAFAPPVSWIPWITVLQGFSIGLFIPASLQVAQQFAPPSVQNTAVAIYTAMQSGGNWFFIFFGGILLDYFPITSVYWFFASFTVLGILFILLQYSLQQKKMGEWGIHE